MALLEMKNITYIDAGNTVIKNVSIPIEKGSVTAFIGKTGSGKSTALKLISGVLNPSMGTVLYNNQNIGEMKQKELLKYRKETGFMFQNVALWANQSIYQNLELPLKIHFPQMTPDQIKERIEEIVQLLEFSKPLQNRPATLSTGEQKKIGFARALICKPSILFLDEPTDSIDDNTTKLFISILKEFCAAQNTLIYVSHDINFINTFSNDKYYFDNGAVVDRILQNDLIQEDYDEI